MDVMSRQYDSVEVEMVRACSEPVSGELEICSLDEPASDKAEKTP